MSIIAVKIEQMKKTAMKYLTKLNLGLMAMALFIMSSCQSKNSNNDSTEVTDTKEINVSLEKVWETDTLLQTAESVIYDEANDVLYVSCIAGVPPLAQDEDGFIAKVSPKDGSILDLNWVTSIDAPKGMGIVAGTLYVTNIDELVAIDIASGEITNRYSVEKAEFLNDITVDSDGNVYFSDTNTKPCAQIC